jgi:hypothetical protein
MRQAGDCASFPCRFLSDTLGSMNVDGVSGRVDAAKVTVAP